MKIKKDIDRNVIVNYTAVFALVLLIFTISFAFFKYGCQKEEITNKKEVKVEKKQEEIQGKVEDKEDKEEVKKEPLSLEIIGAIVMDVDELRDESNGVAAAFIKNEVVMPTAKKKIAEVQKVREKYISYLEEEGYSGNLKDMLEDEIKKDESILEFISNADRRGLENFLKN